MLAALCVAQLQPERYSDRAPVPDANGTFFIDRDWWLFRHVLAFLRDSSLPDSADILQQLYAEAAFYRLDSLRTALEQKCVVVQTEFPVSTTTAVFSLA
jgi:hypothetical protein